MKYAATICVGLLLVAGTVTSVMPSGLPLARAVALRWPDHVAPPCAVLEVVRLRSVATAVPPCAVLGAMSQ